MHKNIQGHPYLEKRGGAIINTDPSLKATINKRRKEQKRLNDLEYRLNRIENLLERILEKNG